MGVHSPATGPLTSPTGVVPVKDEGSSSSSMSSISIGSSAVSVAPVSVISSDEATTLFATVVQNKKGFKKADREAAVAQLVGGLTSALAFEIKAFASLKEVLETTGKSTAGGRAGACMLLQQMAERMGYAIQPVLLSLFAATINLIGDKAKPVREAAQAASDSIFATLNLNATNMIVRQLLISHDNAPANACRLNYIAALCSASKAQIATALSDVIPAVAGDIHALRSEVAEAAKKTLIALCSCCENVDVVPLLPTLISALEDASNNTACVHKLASTTFVEVVDSASLSIICPILLAGFRGRDRALKRSCARIVDNMTTLVEDSRDVAPFVKQLLPLMESAAANLPNPEHRQVLEKAVKVLTEKSSLPAIFNMVEMKEVEPAIVAAAGKLVNSEDAQAKEMLIYVAELMCVLNFTGQIEEEQVSRNLLPFLSTVTDASKAQKIVKNIMETCIRVGDIGEKEEIEENAEELCNCDFSLAYGNKVLLKKTRLRLHRGLRYGLIGKNDCGKTSLMRAIAEYRVEGFPDASELRTVFVETDIPAEYADMNIVDYMLADKLLASLNLTRDQIIKMLNDMGFVEGAPATTDNAVGSLSGGWRMKLALSRAMLLNADILLLDEPTNHLDAYNVKWVEDYLMGLTNVTSIMVSHDSGLLDRVCTNMIQIDSYKLSFYKGNLSEFVKKFPKARAFFELVADKFTFHFPQPGPLQGVNSKGKAIMKMNDITFTYPGAKKAQLNNVTVQISLGSRVACVGVNGAGKSTMIKLLTGELQPDKGSGDIWTHPNARVGYIAQHAFHHIDKHLDKTANEYVRLRYASGADAEEQQKVTNKVTEEEKKMMLKPVPHQLKDMLTGVITKLNVSIGRLTEARRTNKSKNDQEYEVTSKTSDTKFWILRETLMANGWEKILNQVDSRIATRAAMYATPLTQGNVTKHFTDVGLEEEYSTHVPMASLSGGQKVKVVLGAAMWNRPHVLILDEPTNYLDRDSLGALAAAIREFEGGVVMITHNSQFCDNLCPVVWHLQNNTLDVKGDAEWMQQMKKESVATEEKIDESAMVDKFGNTVTLKKNKNNISNKEKKKLLKARAKINRDRKKKGLEPIEYWSDDDDDL